MLWEKNVLSSEDIILFFTKLIWLLKLSYFVIQSDLRNSTWKYSTLCTGTEKRYLNVADIT